MKQKNITTRAEILQRLSAVQCLELLQLMPDDTLLELAGRYFETLTDSEILRSHENSAPNIGKDHVKIASDRAKRPLNAFMAFRCYYLKIFPDVQQKDASGFLTLLWGKDSARNKWALIAKVYSFVRDEIGKDKVSLSTFLGLACPTMGIVQPSEYLETFGWTIVNEEDGPKILCRDEAKSSAIVEQSDANFDYFPSTEMELLSTLVRVGYFPDQGMDLIERMGSNQSGIMTTRGNKFNLPVSYTKEKADFIQIIRDDPIQATKDILGECYDDYTIRELGVKTHNVGNVETISHLSMEREYQDPSLFYNYASTHQGIGLPVFEENVLHFDGIPENESYDINNPFDLDEMLGHTQSEGERSEYAVSDVLSSN
ncbi:MAT1-1-1 [Drechmeria coniospora]|uniref:MAT1-1-1 n=1 Tax=Drechmeria coniospora TaxID=98403 RepID=A0A151GRK4_DRECN|nr:MAT1-1-1 [Drechmeria coniospora]KYK59754.1 MAT1-1-1 [Drechmeria coniospora]